MRARSNLLAIAGAALLAVGLATGCSNSDSTGPTPSATITGRVLRVADGVRSAAQAGATVAGTPVAGAEVIVDGVPSGVFTDVDGEFRLTLDPGTHTIAVNAYGGNSASMSIAVDGTTAMTVEFELHDDGRLTAHEDVDDDGDLDKDDDVDDDGDLDDDDVDDDVGEDIGGDDGGPDDGGTDDDGSDDDGPDDDSPDGDDNR